MIDICLLGTGGMMPLHDRYLTALLIRKEGHSILVDCGEGTQVAIKKYAWSMHGIDTICITHVHGDHVAGISGLLSTMGAEGRTKPVTIIGPSNILEVISQLCVVVSIPFDVYFEPISLSKRYEFNGIRIRPFPVKHNIECYGYRFDIGRRPKFMPERARALNIPVQYWRSLQAGKSVEVDGERFDPAQVLGEGRQGLSLVYSTDTRPCKALEEAARHVDLLITEGIYGDPEKQRSAVEKCHMTTQEACRLARNAQAKRVWLTHYSPSFRDQENYESVLRELNPDVSFGYDGRSITLQFEDMLESANETR